MLLERARRRLRGEELRERDRLLLARDPERERLRGERDRDLDRDREREREREADFPLAGGDLSVECRPLTVLVLAASAEPDFLGDPLDGERDFWRERIGDRE